MSASAEPGFRVVVPVKELDHAKTRLALARPTRRALALAFATDTVGLALSARAVREVVVLTRDRTVSHRAVALGARVLAPSGSRGLNEELLEALGRLRATGTGPTAVLMADLPALRAWELDAALTAGRATGAAFCVGDRVGGGTTLLGGPDGALTPRFGGRSAARHVAHGATRLGEHLDGLRCDVDDLGSLAVAVGLGVGRSTSAVLAQVDERGSTMRAVPRVPAGGAAAWAG